MEITTTAEVLYGMLTENTGTHMLDSGGAYGRNWERNSRLTIEEFMARPAGRVEFDVWTGGKEPRIEVMVTLDAFHWLLERLEYAPEVQEMFDGDFRDWLDEKTGKDFRDRHWLEDMEEFPEWHARQLDGEVETPFGGVGEAVTVNTYNGEDLLSQTLQYVNYIINGEEYCILQVHGGCDVRGGYTAAKCFVVTGEEGCMYENARATLGTQAETVEDYWYTDDGYHWRNDAAWQGGWPQDLDRCRVVKYDLPPSVTEMHARAHAQAQHSRDPENRVWIVHIDNEGNGYSPLTGERFEVWGY